MESSTQNKPKSEESQSIDSLKLKLEKEGEEKVKELLKTGGSIDHLMKIMADGIKEFTEKTGRHMTYGEMRELYG